MRKNGNKWDGVLILWEIGLLYRQSDFNKAIKNMSSLLNYAHRHKLSSLENIVFNTYQNMGVIEMDKTKVFIVHGHDDLAKEQTARLVEKLGLEAIILHEQASGGDTIIEKIEKYSNVGFGIVLYTPCDLGKSKNQLDLKNRARQKVVLGT